MILGSVPGIFCLDFVDIHYHGCPHDEAGELCHTEPRDGTSQCHHYLAGFVLCRAKPLIVAVTPVCGGEQMVEKLDTSVSYWTKYIMYEESERELCFPLAVCVSYQQGNRGKHGLLVRAYVACDRPDRTPKEVKALYQKRSAIETEFRTMREARARTFTTDPVVRLMFILVSFPFRNLWLLVRWDVLATPQHGGRALPVWFRFEVFREWIDHALDDTLYRKWEAPTSGVGIPVTYSQLDAG